MSDDDIEFRESLVHCLESKGILNKVKAELRANVFLALEQQEEGQPQLSIASPKIASFVQTQEGELIVGLVREFLEFFELEYTASVFEPECNLDQSNLSREKLCQVLKLDSIHTDFPLLSQIVWCNSSSTSVELQDPPNINGYSMQHINKRLTTSATAVQTTHDIIPANKNSEIQRQDLSHNSRSFSGTAEVVSDDDITNQSSEIPAPVESISDKNSNADLLLEEYMNSKPLENLYLDVQDLMPSPDIAPLANMSVPVGSSPRTPSSRPRSARGGQRSYQTVSLIDAPPLGLEFEMKSVQNTTTTTPFKEESVNKLYSDFLTRGDYMDDFMTSNHSDGESIDLKLSGANESTLLSIPNETSEHTISAASLVELDYVEDVIGSI